MIPQGRVAKAAQPGLKQEHRDFRETFAKAQLKTVKLTKTVCLT